MLPDLIAIFAELWLYEMWNSCTSVFSNLEHGNSKYEIRHIHRGNVRRMNVARNTVGMKKAVTTA